MHCSGVDCQFACCLLQPARTWSKLQLFSSLAATHFRVLRTRKSPLVASFSSRVLNENMKGTRGKVHQSRRLVRLRYARRPALTVACSLIWHLPLSLACMGFLLVAEIYGMCSLLRYIAWSGKLLAISFFCIRRASTTSPEKLKYYCS